MGKFVKKFSDFVKDRKDSAVNLAFGKTFMDNDKRYKTFFMGVDGFISGTPTKQEELAFSLLWKFPSYGIDTKYNKPARTRCKGISKHFRKNKAVRADDIIFLKNEVRPYLECSFKEQTGKMASLLGKITAAEAKDAFRLFKKHEKAISGKGFK